MFPVATRRIRTPPCARSERQSSNTGRTSTRPVPTDSARTFADGVATRQPQEDAFAVIKRGAARIVQLSEDEIAEAIRLYFHATHQVAEGGGAAPLAALMQERNRMAGKRAGVI